MRIVKKLDIYILKNFITLFLGTFCISLFAVMMQFLWKFMDELVGKGLGYDVIAKFFFYAAETLVPIALPLAILLASLISFGNLGERLELLAIKAAGISLWRTMRPLLIVMMMLAGVSFYFQDVVTPNAENQILLFRYSIMQKSPEVDIPEGVFYDGISGINLYVKQKNKETGMLYDVVIYNMRDGIDNVHIVLSDSARLESSADKQFLLLHLYSGEQFENLRSSALLTKNVPYRRETFVRQDLLIDFDTNLNMADNETFSGAAKTKKMDRLLSDIDSLQQDADSLGRNYYQDMKRGVLYVYRMDEVDKIDSIKAEGAYQAVDIDTLFAHMKTSEQMATVRAAINRVQQQQMDVEFKTGIMNAQDTEIRNHQMKFWEKITLALTCLVFFFIGAPLGAIIRKGGLGLPVVVAVVIFIAYYIINIGGQKMAKVGTVPVVVGMWMSTVILAPIGAFLTIKSNNDSVVFNIDSYKAFFNHLLGIRQKRHISRKEVIIYDPDYDSVSLRLQSLAEAANAYRRKWKPWLLLRILKETIWYHADPQLQTICNEIEGCVEELSNSKNRHILAHLNRMPIIHQEPRFHNRLRRELRTTVSTCNDLLTEIRQMQSAQ